MKQDNAKRELISSVDQIRDAFSVMKHLRESYTEDTYVSTVLDLMKEYGYLMCGLRAGGSYVAVAGYRFGRSLAWGRYVYVDDLVTLPEIRSEGYGGEMMKWIEELAKANGCGEIHLDSGVQRHSAHRFYLRERMDIVFFHFKKLSQ